MKSNNGWHVVYVKFRHEEKVNDELEKLGVESFLPMTSTIKQWSDRKKKVYTPLFPSYVFVNIQSKLDFHKVSSLDSACSFVRFGSEYGRVSEEEINKIKLMIGTEGITEVQANTEVPSVGDRLKIEQGDLSGLECEVYRVDNNHRISVWIKSLRQNISATVPAYYFQKNSTNYAYH